MGIVQFGAFNRKARVMAKTPLRQLFQLLIQALTDSSAGHGSLLLHLRHLSFAEVTGAMSEKSYCYMRAGLYNNNGNLKN